MLLETKIQEYHIVRQDIAKRRALWENEKCQFIKTSLNGIVESSKLQEFYVTSNTASTYHQSVILAEKQRQDGYDEDQQRANIRKGGQLIFEQTKNGLIWVGFDKPTNEQFGENYERFIKIGKYEPKNIDYDLVLSSVVRFIEELTKWEKNEEPELNES